MQSGQTLHVDVDAQFLDDGSSLSTLDSHLRIFDSTGMELDSNDDAVDPDTGISGYDSALAFTAFSTGTYYVGVSGYGNVYYDPTVAGSGDVGSTGDYALQLEVSDPAPEIVVFLDDGYQELYDNASSVDFGTTLEGTAVSKSFVIENYGAGDLNVDFANSTLPNGFVLSDPSGSVTVSPYSSAYFDVELTATSQGNFSGNLALASDDGDENPFEVYLSGQVDVLQADVPGDALADAQSVSLSPDVEQEFSETIGNGLYVESDVDLYQVDLTAGQTLTADVDAEHLDDGTWLSSLDSYLRVFDSSGNELAWNDEGTDPDSGVYSHDAALSFAAASTGTYYVGVSSYDNAYYDPTVPGSGSSGGTGDYKLQLTATAPPVSEPEIAIHYIDGGSNQQDLSYAGTDQVAFPSTSVGAPVTQVFTIDNLGTADLTLDSGALLLPAGFSVESPFAETVVAGASTSLTIQLDAATEGTFSGQVSLTSNDSDENPFAFQVSGDVSGISWTNTAPFVASAGADFAVDEDSAETVIDISGTFDDADIPLGDYLTWSIVDNSNPLLVSASLTGTSLTLSYADNQAGTADITVRATDIVGDLAEDTFTVTVNSVNDAPIAFDNLYRTTHDASRTVSATTGVLANDYDLEQDAIQAELVTGPTSGALTLNADGSFTYTPDQDFTGSDTFSPTSCLTGSWNRCRRPSLLVRPTRCRLSRTTPTRCRRAIP